MILKIGRLEFRTGRDAKALRPGAPIIRLLGTVLWITADKLSNVRDGYLKNPDVYTVVNKIARTASLAWFKVYRVKDEKKHRLYKAWTGVNATKESVTKAMQIKNEAYEEDNEHPLNALLENPNPWQKCREFSENSIGFKLITGERFWNVTRLSMGANEGRPYAIYNLPPQSMVVKGDGTLLGIGGYELSLGTRQDLNKEEVIFSRYWNPDYDSAGGHLRGLSPLKAGSRLVTLSNSGLDRQVAMVQNAGAAGLVYEKPTPGHRGMDEPQATAMKIKLNTEILGVDNANVIGVANGDLGYIPFGMKGSEMELNDLVSLTLEKICSLYSVPPVLFNTDRSIQNNLQEAKKELIISACFPELDSLRDDWNEVAKLYPEDDLWVDYDPSVYPELQEDLEKMQRVALTSWWMKGNEKRKMMFMDEDQDEPLMNEYIIPSGMQLLKDIGMNATDEALNEEGDRETGDAKVSKE